jgi:filamentous hemagglutinin family protein
VACTEKAPVRPNIVRPNVRPSGLRRALDTALLGSVSLLALLVAGGSGEGRSLDSSGAVVALTAAAQQAATAAAQQAAGAAAQAQVSLARAAAALAAMRKVQQDAAAAAGSSSVPNGLTTGGLMPAGGTASDALAGIRGDLNSSTPTNWIGAALPTQTISGSSVTVDITQSQSKAILNWNTFNVGASTTLNFHQSGSDWIALNRVLDPTLAPSQILGHVNAPGAIYVINRNGIIFGAGSQINTHGLIASTLDVGSLGSDQNARNQYFLTTGIANTNSFSIFDPAGGASTTVTGGSITVQPGASITTSVVGLDSPGFVYLFGANVTNAGTITVPAGEVGMVAARAIDLVPNGYSVLPSAVLGTDSSGKALQFRGTEFRISQFAASYDPTTGHPSGRYLSGTGVVTHEGLIVAPRGIVVMNGDRISIDSLHTDATDPNSGIVTDAGGSPVRGVISVDTSIGRNSMVLLRAVTSVDMNGVISSLPFDDGTTLATGGSAGSTVQAFLPAYIEMSAQSTVTVGSSGLISAPSATVALRAINLVQSQNAGIYQQTAGLFDQGATNGSGVGGNIQSNTRELPQTVLLAPGATVDVAGLENVQLPASYNFISFQPRAGEFADMPLQRPPFVSVGADGNGVVYGQTLWIDIRSSGTRSDGTSWVGTPLADASGFVANVGRSIQQLMTTGGTVSLTTDLSVSQVNGSVGTVQTAGSVINVAGGSVNFLPGTVNTTRLLGIDGRMYSMANADPNMTYVGIAGQFTVDHSRWGVKENWSTATPMDSPGYSEGHDAGAVTVTTINPLLSQGTIYFGSVAGERQISTGQLPLQGSLTLTTPSSVQIGSAPSADYTTQSANTTTLSADTLSGYGLSALNVTANDLVVSSGSTLNLAAGGKFSVTAGGAIDIAGNISAAGGAINLVTDRFKGSGATSFKAPIDQSGNVIAANIYVEGGLDVSGRFVNDTGRFGIDATGPAFINGGTISITTNKSSGGNNVDTSGSIKLAAGSLLDVSSGGYISSLGKPKTAAAGVMAGKAGSIVLRLYQGADFVPENTQGGPIRPTSGPLAVLQLDGTLRGYGFESNGSLTLGSADTIRIGGTLQPGETSMIQINGQPSTVPVSLLTGGGFSAYTIESVPDGWSGAAANVIVSAGVNLGLQQQNLSSTSDYSATATGTKLGQQPTPPLALLQDDQRKPVNLAFKAGNVAVGGNILLGTGASIVTDPKATITFGGIDLTLKLGGTRDVAANSVELLGSIVDHGGNVFVNSLQTHLGPQALVDLSGTFVANSGFGAVGGMATSGTYLSGGTFAVEAGSLVAVSTLINQTNPNNNKFYYTYGAPGANGAPSGYVVADAGATVDVSGAAGTVQVQGSRGSTSSVWSWSDAGTVSADVGGFAWGGSFVATGGRYVGTDGITHADPRANNGTLILGGGAITLRQDTTDVNGVVAGFHAGANPTAIWLAADQVNPFDNVFLYSGSATGGAARFFNELPAYNRLSGSNVLPQTNEVPGSIYNIPNAGFATLTISGSLNWHVGTGLRIAAGAISSNTAGSAVTLDAPYVLLTGGGGTPVVGNSTLTVSGKAIDVEGASFSGFVQASLISSGDIRLSTPKVSNTIDLTTGASTYPASFKGSLDTKGDLLLEAQRIYPVSAVDFTITTPGNVKFAAPAGSNTALPLAAGGSLTVNANTIDQAGNLFAPLGKITLGNTTTQSVTLEPGSLTSVTLADTTVPYGATQDGTNWYYNANLKPLNLDPSNPLARPPAKGLVLTAANVTRADGSTIDLRGGGDLQAMEWIQGQGGSRDTLTTTPSGQTVYALLPSQTAAVAAFDIHFNTARSLDGGKTVIAGDTYPLAGTQITIDGGNGIPAGTYTLYPAHYATLPGAMRVVYYGDNTSRNLPSGTTLPDGTVLVTGHTTQSTALTKQSSGQSLFAVQTGDVWKQYSEFTLIGANSYFRQLAAKLGVTTPALAMDAGRLSVLALQSIILNGIALTQPGQDSSGNIGRGSELDLSAPQLAVVGHTQYVNNDIPAGYVGLDVAQLKGFESILIGGQRSDTTTGTLITPSANSVLVDTHGDKFTAPEILLVAKTVGTLQSIPQALTLSYTDPVTSQVVSKGIYVETQVFAPAPNSGTVTIAAGSVIATAGTVHAGTGRKYYFAAPSPNGPITAQGVATALGGTLDASGTVITGVDPSKLSYFAKNADGSFVTNPDGSVYQHVGAGADLTNLQQYAYQTTPTSEPQLGGLFVATGDTSLKVSGPTGVAVPSLTIQFAGLSDSKLSGTATGTVSGSLVLPTDAGRVVIAPGVNITTKSLTLQATASTNAIVINSSDLHAQQLNLTARTIGLGSPTPVTDKSLAVYNGQFADVQALSLKALSGTMTVYNDFNPGLSVTSLTLDAAALVRADSGGSANISLSSGTITLVNTGGASAPTSTPSSSGAFGLTFAASDIVLGVASQTSGVQTMLGYSQVNLSASDRVLLAGPGGLTLGAGTDVVDFNVATPSILVAGATGATGTRSFAVSTNGNIRIGNPFTGTGVAQRPADSTEIGGNLALTGASITIGSTIQAQAGTVTLEAKSGDVALVAGAYIAAGGAVKTLVDVNTYVAGGKVVLQADNGNVTTDANSVIDVAQPVNGFGYGGEIDVTALTGNATLAPPATALAGNATLAGTLLGGGGPGLGGRFKLDIKGAADLTALADKLLPAGLTGAIDIHTGAGNLELLQGHTLKANAITLTADDTSWDSADKTKQLGQVIIAGIVDASGYSGKTLDGTGQAGGQVGLYGANQVLLAGTGVIDASTTHADERGGDVTVGIAWAAQGNILLQTGTQINVSGGTKGGLSGGTVTFRAPRDGNGDAKIWAIDGAGNVLPTIDPANIKISGARSVTVDAFVAFDTKASSNGIDGSQLGWNGTIDPAGWYNPDGTLATSGSWSNVSGWRVSGVSFSTGFSDVPNDVPVADLSGAGTGAMAHAIMGLFKPFFGSSVQSPPGLTPNTVYTITFPTPPGGVAATGTASTDANGQITSITIDQKNPGSGYTKDSLPTSFTIGGLTAQVSGLKLSVVSAQIVGLVTAGYSSGSNPAATFFGGGGIASVSFSQGTGTFAPGTGGNIIPFASSGVFSPFDPTTQGTPGVATFTGSTQDRTFFATTLVQATQGTWSYNGKNYGFDNLFAKLQPLVAKLGSGVVHVQPGIELVNSGGAITVANNWNLASGTAGNLQTNPTTGQSYFDPTRSFVNFDYRLATPWGSLEAPDLTLRATGNINVYASISDGFFQFGNYLDPNYVSSSLPNNSRTIDRNAPYTYYLNSSGAVPIAPYNAAGNAISPTAQDLAVADPFPNQLRVCTVNCSSPNPNVVTVTAPSSSSYRLTAGADTASANRHATISLASAQQGNSGAGIGSVIVDNRVIVGLGQSVLKQNSYTQSLINDISGSQQTTATVYLPTMVRTGTGNISIAAALDVVLQDTTAPGVIYAAGVNTAKLADPNYGLQTVNGVSSIVASNPDGFFEPQVLAYGNGGTNGSGVYYGPPTAAAFPERGGDVVVDAQRDIVGYSGTGNKTVQYYQPWLLSDTGLTPVTAATAGTASLFGAGVFAPSGTNIASQTAWWIQYGSFQQGILSAGGNASITAGRDLVDVSVSLPTTGRVSGGLSAASTPVTHIYGGGNMVVRAGRDILGGSFYEGSGHASIMAGGSVGQNGTVSRYASSKLFLPDYPLLAVDTGQIAMVAGGSIAVSGVVNPAELHTQNGSFASPSNLGDGTTFPLYMDTYGPDSKVRLVATTGDLTITVAPTAIHDGSNGPSVNAAASMYPASLEALALSGNLITTGITINQGGQLVTIEQAGGFIPTPGIVLSPSDHGTFELLAQGNVDLTFGYPKDTLLLATTPRPFISAGPALIDTAFDPFQPNSGFDGAFSGSVLAHQNDAAAQLDTTARIYAASGDILATGSYGRRTSSDFFTGYQRIEINRPAKVFAGRDIVDLNLIVQNINPADVSTVNAGRNITYTGFNNGGGLQVAGPGFFVVQAGGDIGPFLPAAQDIAGQAKVQEGIASVGNASAVPVGDIYVTNNGGSVGLYDAALYGPSSNPRRNALLTTAANTSQGADVVVLFGTKFGADYQAVINIYIDPANAAKVTHNYITELQAFLVRIGKPASATDPTTIFNAFKSLSPDLQQVFVDQVFFAELKTVAVSQQAGNVQYQPGYLMINTMFPSSRGYTANALGGGTANGAGQLVKTGDLNLEHGTIQTQLGGAVSIFGPGGSILVGPLATEPNPNLRLRDLGIITLGGGGINTFTDASVLVNSSRVLTTQGGDILMWSSNGDLDAGRGSKTTISQPPLQVQYNADDFQSVDLGGFVSGAGIGTLKTSTAAAAANLYLLAPRGKIDFGSAGVRASGNLVVVAPVVVNSSNAAVAGTTTGVAVISVPNIGALTSGSNTAGASTKSAEAPTAAGGRDQASIFIVEVIGYGGGDGQNQAPADNGQSSDDKNKPKP